MRDVPRPPGLPTCKACPSRIRRRDGSIIHADGCPLDAPLFHALADAFQSLCRMEQDVAKAKQRAAEALQEYRSHAIAAYAERPTEPSQNGSSTEVAS